MREEAPEIFTEERSNFMADRVQIVRTYKDTLFRYIFKDKAKLLELYNALNGTDYTDPEDLEIYTLENVIYMGVKNDISVMLGSYLSLYEQQATFNPNMPLRDLIYVTKQFEKYIAGNSIYSSQLVRIPVPKFVVFYNGTKNQPEKQILKLSDAYEKEVDDPELELKVTMLNINLGQNKKLLKKCRPLREYSTFVAKVREKAALLPIAEAVDLAVTECIREGILADILTAQRAEVIAMSIFEYDEELELKKLRKAEREGGIAAGIELGTARGKTDSIILLLADLGEISDALRGKITAERNLDILNTWLKLAAKAASIEEFEQKM